MGGGRVRVGEEPPPPPPPSERKISGSMLQRKSKRESRRGGADVVSNEETRRKRNKKIRENLLVHTKLLTQVCTRARIDTQSRDWLAAAQRFQIWDSLCGPFIKLRGAPSFSSVCVRPPRIQCHWYRIQSVTHACEHAFIIITRVLLWYSLYKFIINDKLT